MTRVSREALLRQLEAVQPGLSPRDVIEQSSCFVFVGGRVITFNGEITCSLKTDLEIEGAIQAKPLLEILRKMHEEEIEVHAGDGEFVITGKKRSCGVRMDAEIMLPMDSLEKPSKWKELHEDFLEAINIVQQCTGKDESRFWSTCVHLHPKWVEACDNDQISRYRLPTGVAGSTLVRGSSIKHILGLDMTHFCETESWIHFKNPAGITLSCLRFLEEYPSLKNFLAVTGDPMTLPRGIGEATARAEIFSADNPDNNRVQVELKPGKMRIKGNGASGWYVESKALKYSGRAINFLITPKLLVEMSKHHNQCEVTQEALKVNGGKFTYVTCLGKEDEVEEENDEAAEESKPKRKKSKSA